MRRLSTFLLVLCLVFSQEGALLHALRHEFPQTDATADGGGTRPDGATCSVCLAFAHIVGVATSATVPTSLLSLAFHWLAPSSFARRPSDPPRARSRDPPVPF